MAEIITGARARFLLGGVKVGYATRVSLSENITFEPIVTLDSLAKREHAPTDYDVQLEAAMVRIVNDTVKSRGWFPKQGQSDAEFLSNVITQGVLDAVLEDSQTGTMVAKVTGVRMASRSVTIDARGVVGTDVSFVALRARDESDLT